MQGAECVECEYKHLKDRLYADIACPLFPPLHSISNRREIAVKFGRIVYTGDKRIFSISLNSQNICLCHAKPNNNGSFLLTTDILATETVNKCLRLQMARMETDYHLKD